MVIHFFGGGRAEHGNNDLHAWGELDLGNALLYR